MAKQSFQKPKGTADLLPGESLKWHYVEETARVLFGDYQYSEVRTPIFESFDVFARSAGDTSDVVTKEMYDFHDKGDRHVALRPEGTAGVVRAFVENKLFGPEHQKPYKMFYIGPMFRYERPQAGRMRQFHQIGVEALGSDSPALDAEVIAMAVDFFQTLGVTNLKVKINSLGDKASRENYRQALINFLTPHFDELSADSQTRLEKNPLRVLDSKDAKDQAIVADAPSILDYLTESAQAHWDKVQTYLEAMGIDYEVDANVVRGLDYYNHTIFEFTTEVAGNQLTICAGGRYDGLVAYFGGPETPGVGFGMGLERLLLVLDKQGVELPIETGLDAYIAVLGAGANGKALELVQSLRAQGFAAERDYLDRKIKAQFKSADIFQAKTIITLGESELESGELTVKNNETRQEVTVSLDAIKTDFQAVLAQIGL